MWAYNPSGAFWEGQGQPVDDQPGMRLWSSLRTVLRVAHAPAGRALRNVSPPTQLDELHGETIFRNAVLKDRARMTLKKRIAADKICANL